MTEPFLATLEGTDQVLRAGRRRRHAKLSGLGSSALVLVVGIGLLGASGPGGHRGIEQVTTVPTSPTPIAVDPSPTQLPDPSPTGGEPSASPTPESDEAPAPGDASPPATEPQDETRPPSPVTRAEAGYLATGDLCQEGTPTSSWCLRMVAPDKVRRGEPVTLGLTVCLLPTAQRTTVKFASSNEVSVSVNRSVGNEIVWEAGEGVPETESGGSLSFEPGQCHRWTARWDTRDRDGYLLPPGSYPFGGGFGDGRGVYATGTTLTVVD